MPDEPEPAVLPEWLEVVALALLAAALAVRLGGGGGQTVFWVSW